MLRWVLTKCWQHLKDMILVVHWSLRRPSSSNRAFPMAQLRLFQKCLKLFPWTVKITQTILRLLLLCSAICSHSTTNIVHTPSSSSRWHYVDRQEWTKGKENFLDTLWGENPKPADQQANANWCLVGSFSSFPAIPMTLMGALPMSSSMAVPWWFTSRSDPFLNCSITVVITTLAKGINWPKMSHMSIILM